MVNLKKHPDYKSIRHDSTNNSLHINTKRQANPYMIVIKDFTSIDWDDFKETGYSKKYLEENIFNNQKYHLIGNNTTILDSPFEKKLDFGKYQTWVKIIS